MAWRSLIIILLSVLLGGAAQVAFKYGMTREHVQLALGEGQFALLQQIFRSPFVLAGLAAYAASALLWLGALSRVELSIAYPFVALSIVITVLAGAYLFAEALTPLRLSGAALICLGVVMVALSQPTAD